VVFAILEWLCFGPRRRCGLSLLGMLVVVTSVTTVGISKEVPRSGDQITLSFAPLVRKAGPAVVNVFATKEVEGERASRLFGDPFFRHFFDNMVPGQPRRRRQKSLGSGVILDPNGLIVTNHHVIANATEVKVVLSDRREFSAKVLMKDERTDLAVLKIDVGVGKLPYVEMRDSDTVEVGDLVLAIGNPFGVGQTVTSGIVSALARTAIGITDYSFFIQTDAAINPGNSGGALIAMDGRLIGINTAIFSNKGGAGGSVGIGFAIPSNMVGTVLQSAQTGRLVRPWFGVTGQTVTQDLAVQFGLDRPSGVLINKIFPAGPADRAGLEIGDVVVSIAGKGVDDNDALRYRVATFPVGKTAEVEVIRKGRHLVLDLALDAPPGNPAAEITNIDGRNPLSGARVANLSPAFALENGLDDMARGVVVLGVRRGSIANTLGLRNGDIVTEVNGKGISSVSDLIKAVRKVREVWRIAIRRGDKVLRTKIKG
jgi:Do/DeqQ family serine protease